MRAIRKIEEQQEKLPKGSAAWVAGEQLKDICRREPDNAEIVSANLDIAEMSISHAEKKIKAWADKHKTGNFAFVSPDKAEEILREFYGIQKKAERPVEAPEVLDLASFL